MDRIRNLAVALYLLWILLSIRAEVNNTIGIIAENNICDDLADRIRNRTLQFVSNISQSSDICHNHRGYPTVETCITDCELMNEDYTNCIYGINLYLEIMVLHVKSGEFIEGNGQLHVSMWNITKSNDSYRISENGETAFVCMQIPEKILDCREGEILEKAVELRDGGHIMYHDLLQTILRWNEFVYHQGVLIYCLPEEIDTYNLIVEFILAGSIISIIFLCLGILLSTFIPILRKKPILLCHMIMLALSYVVQCCQILIKNKSLPYCISILVFLHFFLLSSFIWMNFHALDLYLAVRSIRTKRALTIRRFLIYASVSWGLPLVLMSAAVIAELMDAPMKPGFKLHCSFEFSSGVSFIYYHGWTSLSIFINGLIFFLTVYAFKKLSTEVASANKKTHKTLIFVSIKLFIAMGFIWIFEIILWAKVRTIVANWLEILASFQGLFIFLIYVCRKKIFNNVKNKMKEPFSKKEPPVSVSTII